MLAILAILAIPEILAILVILAILAILQGVPKKMSHSDFYLKSVPEVRLYFFTCVSESEFQARSI